MEYTLRKATIDDYDLLKDYKRHSIFDYAVSLSDEEIKRINEYIDNNFDPDAYVIILIDKNVAGAYLVDTTDGNLLDEIYIEKPYRKKGLGSSILKELIKEYPNLSLWVYKENSAVNLYRSLGFKIDQETDTRYHMIYNE